MSASRFALAFCLLAGLAACKVTPAADESPPAGETEAVDSPSRAGEQPAVIVNPTPEGRAELEHVVSDMLFGAEVTLPMDALTKSSVLVLERERIKRLGQPPLPRHRTAAQGADRRALPRAGKPGRPEVHRPELHRPQRGGQH